MIDLPTESRIEPAEELVDTLARLSRGAHAGRLVASAPPPRDAARLKALESARGAATILAREAGDVAAGHRSLWHAAERAVEEILA